MINLTSRYPKNLSIFSWFDIISLSKKSNKMILNDLNHLNHFSIDETRFQSYMFPNMSPP